MAFVCLSSLGRTQPAAPNEAVGPRRSVDLTFDQAISMARQSAPDVLVAQAKVAEASGMRAGAEVFPRKNPVLEGGAGPIVINDQVQATAIIGISQSVDLGGGVTARVQGVQATVDRADAAAAAAGQMTARRAAAAYLRMLWAEERIKLTTELAVVAQQVAVTAEKRRAAGDATASETVVAGAGAIRARAAGKAAEAERDIARGELVVLLNLPGDTQLRLKGTLSAFEKVELDELVKQSQNRPDLRALAAERREAQADLDLADALSFPELTFGVSYELQQWNVHSILGTLAISLPFADHAQGLTASAKAKLQRVDIEQALRRSQASAEVLAAFEVYKRRSEAVAVLEEGGVSGYAENLRLAARGFEAGETTLSEMLLIRRELADAQLEFLDARLASALAAVELRAAAGALP